MCEKCFEWWLETTARLLQMRCFEIETNIRSQKNQELKKGDVIIGYFPIELVINKQQTLCVCGNINFQRYRGSIILTEKDRCFRKKK